MEIASDPPISVPLRWRDLDHQGHLYHGTMLTLLDEARTEWFRSIGIDCGDSYVVARVEIDYLAETTRSDVAVEVDFAVARVGNRSITTHETARTGNGVVARALVTAVMWDSIAHRSRELTSLERESAEGKLVGAPTPSMEVAGTSANHLREGRQE